MHKRTAKERARQFSDDMYEDGEEVVLCINTQLKREPGSSRMICMRMEKK